MVRSSVGTKLYLGVMAIFLLFAVSFIVFQHDREKRYKIDVLDTRLQDYNERMAEVLAMNRNMTEKAIDAYVKDHYEPDMRVTVIDMKGRVIFDNKYKDYARLENHLGRDEVRQALRQGSGYDIDRIWPKDVLVLDRTVDVNITRLRKKIGRFSKCIVTRLGFGYYFDA